MSEDTLPELQAEYARLATALATAPSAEQPTMPICLMLVRFSGCGIT